MLLNYISYLTFLASFSRGADILAILPMTSYSHQIAYSHLWKELSLRGHKVTTITTIPLKDPTLKNLTQIYLNSIAVPDLTKAAETIMTTWNIYQIFTERFLKIAEAQLSSPSVQNLIHNKTNFDVVFVEYLYPEFLAFAEIYNCPSIVFSPHEGNYYIHQFVGNPTHPVLYPDFVTPFYGPLNFMERVESTLFSTYLSYLYGYKLMSAKQKLMEKYFSTKLTMKELMNNIDMFFLNINPVIQGSRAVGPTTIYIGGHRKPVDLTPLPKNIEHFLDNAKEGFIYFSLGGNVKSKELSEETFRAIFEALSEVPYKVLWKYENDTLPGKPDNVEIIKWAPQEKVLAHPNIKLFVNQAGLLSMEEGIYNSVPFVVIPFYADHMQNAKIMKSRGIAVVVERKPSLKKEELKSAILEVINNPSYRNSVKRIKQLALDTPMTGLEKAVWWTEYVIRNKGAKHLRNPAADIPSYQFYLLDVISFVLIVIALVLLILISLIKILYRLITNILVDKKLIKYKKS